MPQIVLLHGGILQLVVLQKGFKKLLENTRCTLFGIAFLAVILQLVRLQFAGNVAIFGIGQSAVAMSTAITSRILEIESTASTQKKGRLPLYIPDAMVVMRKGKLI